MQYLWQQNEILPDPIQTLIWLAMDLVLMDLQGWDTTFQRHALPYAWTSSNLTILIQPDRKLPNKQHKIISCCISPADFEQQYISALDISVCILICLPGCPQSLVIISTCKFTHDSKAKESSSGKALRAITVCPEETQVQYSSGLSSTFLHHIIAKLLYSLFLEQVILCSNCTGVVHLFWWILLDPVRCLQFFTETCEICDTAINAKAQIICMRSFILRLRQCQCLCPHIIQCFAEQHAALIESTGIISLQYIWSTGISLESGLRAHSTYGSSYGHTRAQYEKLYGHTKLFIKKSLWAL